MKNLLLLLILSLFSAQSFAGSCSDGSEPVKSISADGTYFVYSCSESNDGGNNSKSENLELIDDLIKNKKITILAASDVSKEYIENTKKWLNLAVKTWFNKGSSEASNYYYPIVVTIVNKSTTAARELETELCKEIDENRYSSHLCGRYLVDYVATSDGSISSNRMNDGVHLMILGIGRRSDSDDLGDTVLHEAFHIYQLSHVTAKDRDMSEKKLGSRSGSHNRKVPWWMEGTAVYMSYRLYDQQPGSRNNFLKSEMGCNIGYRCGNSEKSIEKYFNTGSKLNNIDFGKNRMLGYRMGSWFVAYLFDQVGEEKIFEFYKGLDNLGFEDSFEKHFGKNYLDYIEEFEVFINQKPAQLIKILPS
jgi:hypothetical protein